MPARNARTNRTNRINLVKRVAGGPARRRKKVQKQKTKKDKKLYVVGVLVISLLAAVVWFFTSRSIESSKFVVAHENSDGSATVAVYDMGNSEITKINVPGETYITSAYGYGEWRVASLGKLGRQERRGGELLRMSLVKSFHFPIDAWVEGSAIMAGDSSLNMRQKLQLAWFAWRLPKQNWSEIDLSKRGYLTKSKLPDGEEGYLLTRQLPPELGTVFSSSSGAGILRVGIYNSADRGAKAIENLSEVIHILGGDWAVIQKEVSDNDCLIRGDNELLVNRISQILLCKKDSSPKEGNFDIEIIVGNKFRDRF